MRRNPQMLADIIERRQTEAEEVPPALTPTDRALIRKLGDLSKRALDAVAAFFGLIVLSPALVLVGILIKRDSPGPVFYRGPRVGMKGKLFNILKFRTMYERPESHNGPRLTSKEDPRITPLGHWLRNTKINELPQLWNVLVGDMSLVGPRPEDPALIDARAVAARQEVLSVRPGITSPASVLYHSEEEMLSGADLMGTYLKEILPDKVRLDHLYVRNRSFASDLDVIFWTLAIFIPRLAKMSIPEGLLFAGPFSRLTHRYVSWFLLDFLIALTSVSVAGLLWRAQEPFNWGWEYMALLALGLALMFSAVNYLAGLDRIIWSRATAEDAIGLFFTAGLVTLAALVLNHLQETYHWSNFPALPVELILTLGLMAQLGFISARYRLRLLTWIAEGWLIWRRNAPGTGERVLILGDGETCQIANWLLKRGMFRHAFSVVGIVAVDDPTNQGMRLDGCWVVGGIRDLPSLVRQHDVRMVVYTLSSTDDYVRNMVFTLCKSSTVKLVFLDDLLAFIHQQLERPAVAREYLEWLQQRRDEAPFRDVLTELPNAALLQECVRHSLACARRYRTRPALLMIDLNGMDTLNGTHGLRMEEELLKAVAVRLKGSKRESDTLARVKDHQFALLLENVPDESAAETIIKRTMTLMTEPFLVRGREIPLNADIGIFLPAEDLEGVRELKHCNLGNFYAGWRRTADTAFEHLAGSA